MITYLMLDKDDISICHGTITSKEVKKELGINDNQFKNMLNQAKVYKDKYILVEDFENKNQEDAFNDKLFYETESLKRYYATRDGKFYVIYKSGKTKYLSGYLKKKRDKDVLTIKASDKEYTAKNLIASLFIEEYKPKDTVLLKNNNPRDVSADNLIVVDKATYAKMTGAMSRSKKVGLYENGKLIKTYRSAREAGRRLYCSYQMICDICNNRFKKKEFDLRWI